MSPSLKYLMVSSIAARNASSDPMSSTATLGALEVASMLLVMWAVAPVDGCRDDLGAPAGPSPRTLPLMIKNRIMYDDREPAPY
jgi:hypothetical protein